MKKQNVLESKKRKEERREQIKTATLSKRFLAAFLSLVLIVGIIPASIKLSTANIKKKATFETAQVEELKAVKLKDRKENRKKEETDNEDENEMVKVPVEGDLSGKKTISFNSNKFQKKDSVVDKIQVTIDGVAQKNKTGDNIIAAVRAGDMENSNDIVVVAISNAFKIPNSAVLEGVYVSQNNKKQSEVAALRVLDNGEVFYSLPYSSDTGIKLEKDEHLFLKYTTRYNVSYKVNNEIVTLGEDNKGYGTGIEIEGSPYVWKEHDKFKLMVNLEPGYEITGIRILDGNKDIAKDALNKLTDNKTIEIASSDIKSDLTVNIDVEKQTKQRVKTKVSNGEFKLIETVINTNNSEKIDGNNTDVKVKKGETAHIIIDSDSVVKQYGKIYVFILDTVTINNVEIPLPNKFYNKNQESEEIDLNGSKVKVKVIDGVNDINDSKNEKYRLKYDIEISDLNEDMDVNALFELTTNYGLPLAHTMRLNTSGISDTAGMHTTVLYKFWAGIKNPFTKEGINIKDGGYNLAFWLDPGTSNNIHDFYTIDRIKEVAADEENIPGATERTLFLNYKLNSEAAGMKLGSLSVAAGPDQQYIDNVYLYKPKPGYNPYNIKFFDFKTDGTPVESFGGNAKRPIIYKSNTDFTKYSNEEKSTVGNEVKKMVETGECSNDVINYRKNGKLSSKEIKDEYYPNKNLRFNFMESKNINWLNPKTKIYLNQWPSLKKYRRKTNNKVFRTNQNDLEANKNNFENIILTDWHISQVGVFYHGCNRDHHHWSKNFWSHQLAVGTQRWALGAPDTNINCKLSDFEDEGNKETYSDPMIYNGSNVTMRQTDDSNLKSFFPAVFDDDWYYGFIVPTSINRYYMYREWPEVGKFWWSVYGCYHTPIDYGDNVELSVEIPTYKYGVEYKLNEGKFKEKVTGLKNNKRDLKRYDIEKNNTITMPEQRPYRKGYQFVGWSLDKIGVRGNTQKSYSDKSGNKLLYKPGEKFVITDDVAGLYKIDKSGDILYSGYATPEQTYKTGVPTKDNDLKLCFVANWKKNKTEDWDTSYDIVVKAQDKTTKEDPLTQENDGKRKYDTITNEYGYGTSGKKIDGITLKKPKDDPENGYYYYLDKSKSKTEVQLDENNKKDNKIEYVYNLASTITIKNEITGDYATADTRYPVILTLKSKNKPVTDDIACRYNIGKPEHKRFLKSKTKGKSDENNGYRLGVLKFRNGICQGLFDKKTGILVEGTDAGIPMWNENEILIDQMRANDYVLGVTIANNGNNIKPERKVYLGENTPVKLNKNGSFNDEISKDNIYTIKNSADKKIKTGAYRRISPYIPIAIAVGVLLGNVIYVIITNRMKIKK